MINIDEEYKGLVSGVFYSGVRKQDRTGTGTISVFGRQISHDMDLGFPLLTTKKVYFNHALTELIWMLNGRTDMQFLEEHGVKYWTPDYNRSGRTDGTLGKVYGYQWRNFNGIDQLFELMFTLQNEPTSRRMMVSAWNPADMEDMVLPPCHYGFQVYTRDLNLDERIAIYNKTVDPMSRSSDYLDEHMDLYGVPSKALDLMWTQRSVDVFLGLPYDIAIYGLLLLYLAKGFGYKPGRLIGQLGDCHLYSNHEDAVKELLTRNHKTLPKVTVDEGLKFIGHNEIFIPTHNMVTLENYNPHPPIKAPLSVGN